MNKKKWAIGAAGLLLSLSLAACGQGKTVATTDGGKITQEEFYDKMKSTQQGKAQLQQMILNKCLEHEYGSKVKQSEVDKQFDKYKSQYGPQFDTILQQQGMTESQLKESIKNNLLLKEAVLDKTDFSNKQLEKQFKKYQPKVTVKELVTKDEESAQSAISDLNNGTSWKDVAKQYGADDNAKKNGGQEISFDNATSGVDNSVKKAAYKLNKGEYSKTPIKTEGGYVVIEMVKHPKKGTLKEHKAEIKDQLANERLNDRNTVHKVVSEVLKDNHVQIEDSSMKNILSGYLDTSKK
ncbi:peptidyl-prolyl cis-trans isomerase [Fructilactobacillus myrtifloralis]|uniref:Foldase protein PrsA n=1 Tax=Fructilactobacillus myrtifloralis TaxID=2940301 RepID=A0ABY5BNH8_9LACO|nr:peptidyl-prolyl cis-trans isomerase [Fructilactobacillus myrtifloralis]USS85227.1 peptidyl-prolyl cis-trans isomerase [Fructilactobacillus myrtifloralis]